MDDALPARLRLALRRIAPTHRAAAREIGLGPTQLSKSLHGVRRLTLAEAVRIAELAEVDLTWLLEGRGPAPAIGEADPEPSRTDDRRDRYVAAAWELISERGMHAVRVADIAALSGTSPAAVHYHFATKQEVLAAAMDDAVRRAFERQREALREEDDARARLELLIDHQVPDTGQVRREWSVWLQVWAESALRPDLRAVHHRYYQGWRSVVERTIVRGQRQGVFRPVDAAAVATRFTALADGLGIQVATGSPTITGPQMRRILTEFVAAELLPSS